ncbi:MAG: hypothetical protein KGM24_00540 [Elusimicrobia bacterium]|nr:hypothetical protein [Elusimicrobiota bacterium]
MSVTLSPVAPRTVSVGAAADPYKKYWGAILGGFVLTGLWLCLPMMEPQIGSTHVDAASRASAGGDGSLDAAPIPSNGAPGAPIDLSKDAASAPSGGVDATSMLYTAPAGGEPLLRDGAPVGASGGSSASANLAQQLKKVGRSDGWGGQAPQRGFAMPNLSGGGGLSGLGSVSGGSGATASAGSGGGGGAFGTGNAVVGRGTTVGLTTGADEKAAAGGLSALKSAAAQAQLAAARSSGDSSVNALSHIFDGGKKSQSKIGLNGSAGGAYAAMDEAAPINLKQLTNPETDQKKYKAPPPAAPAPSSSNNNQMAQQMAMMIGGVLIGGLIPGAGGQMVMMMAMMMMQQQQQAAAATQAAKDQAAAEQRVNGASSFGN